VLKIGRCSIGIHKAEYLRSEWYYYWYPRRLTFKHNPPCYKWLFWVFGWNERGIK
jgi:hypothetical protein